MSLIIVGNPKDVERYKKQRGVVGGVDPSTGQNVAYGGLKRFGPDAAQRLGQNNPWVKYGPEFRMGLATFKTVKPQGREYNDTDRITIMGIANANIIDRYDERLAPEGVITATFTSNPVLLVDHAYWTAAVVGRVTNITPEHDGVKFEAYVGDPGAVGGIQNLTEQQRNTRSLVAQGLLQTVSVGFIPKKIQAPVYDKDGRMIEPAVILQWELLELSIVAIPANPGSIFEMKQYALALNTTGSSGGVDVNAGLTATAVMSKNINEPIEKGAKATAVQTLIFDKELFTEEQAIQWAKDHGYRADKVDDTEGSYRLRQRDPSEFVDGSFRTIELTDGVQAVIGQLESEGKEMTEDQAKQLIDAVAALGGKLDAQKELLVTISSQNEKIIGHMSGEKPNEESEESKALKASVAKHAEEITQIKSTMGKIDTILGDIHKRLK